MEKAGCRLYVFNPDCELAIADGGRFYMPPANIVRMAEDLAYLPAYLGEEGDGVLVPRAVPCGFNGELGVPVRPVMEGELADGGEGWHAEPWGRSPRMCHWLAARGMGEEWQEGCKEAYSRRTALGVLLRLREELPFVGEEVVPAVCHSLAEVHRHAGRGNWIVKAPWSSSGKGQLRLGHPFYPKADEWMGGVLKRQGYLMLERHLDKVADFAMEFQAVGGKVEFMGWSCFETGEHGEYLGNRVAPQEVLEVELRGFLDSRWLLALKSCLPPALQEAFPGYEGYLGVDMLVYRGEGGEMRLHPCVEINLRCNMGILALRLQERYLAPGAEGYFSVRFYPRGGEALAHCLQEGSRMPAVFRNNRLLGGFLPLAPVEADSCFVAALHARR